MQTVLSGKASSEQAVLDVLDRLKANPKLSNVESGGIRRLGDNTKEVSFVIKLKLRGVN